jgi:hypothetical protein
LNDNTFEQSSPTPNQYQFKQLNSTSSFSQSSSTLTSFMTSPISSLQNFTNMIPLPWSSPSSRPVDGQADESRLALIGDNDMFINQLPSARPADTTALDGGSSKRGYVSKEAQLKKLRIRFSQEKHRLNKADHDHSCKMCIDELVFL